MESLWVWRLGLSSQFINLISKIDPHSKNCLPIVEILVLAIPLMKVSGCVANSDPEINKLINFISKKVFLHQCHSYFLLKTEQKPDKYGYVTPRERSNQPVTMDVVLFNRSASSAAEVRARQLADAERKSRSLPGGMYFKDKSWKIYCDDHSSLSKISLSRSKFSSWCTVTIYTSRLPAVSQMVIGWYYPHPVWNSNYSESHVIQSACNRNIIVSSILTSFRCVSGRHFRTSNSTECYFWKDIRQGGEPVLTETG